MTGNKIASCALRAPGQQVARATGEFVRETEFRGGKGRSQMEFGNEGAEGSLEQFEGGSPLF
jgi:hypothetical protein